MELWLIFLLKEKKKYMKNRLVLVLVNKVRMEWKELNFAVLYTINIVILMFAELYWMLWCTPQGEPQHYMYMYTSILERIWKYCWQIDHKLYKTKSEESTTALFLSILSSCLFLCVRLALIFGDGSEICFAQLRTWDCCVNWCISFFNHTFRSFRQLLNVCNYLFRRLLSQKVFLEIWFLYLWGRISSLRGWVLLMILFSSVALVRNHFNFCWLSCL